MASNNEYEHQSWHRRLLCDMFKDRNVKKYNMNISANFVVVDGELVFGSMLRDGVEVTGEFDRLMLLDRVIRKKLEGWEKEFQRGFMPDERTTYILPPDLDK